MLGKLKKRMRIRARNKEDTRGLRECRAWRRMVIELALVTGTKQK
jgi:hypothetical protein